MEGHGIGRGRQPVAVAAGLLACAILACEPPRPPPLPAGVTVALRGFAEVALADDGNLVHVLSPGKQLGVCLTLPAIDRKGLDPRQWELACSFSPSGGGGGFAPAEFSLGRTACFPGPRPPARIEGGELSCTLRDGFDAALYELPPQAVRVASLQLIRFLDEMTEARRALTQRSAELPFATLSAEIDALAERARAGGLPFFAVNMALTAVDFAWQQRTPEGIAEAERRLAALPAWVEQMPAARLKGQALRQRAEMLIHRGRDLRTARDLLLEAEERLRAAGDSQSLYVTLTEARMLSDFGAAADAYVRLRAALEECQRAPCYPYVQSSVEQDLAWQVIIDPDATHEALAGALAAIERALADEEVRRDPLELANQRLNLALLEVRRGEDPGPDLAAVRALLDGGSDPQNYRRLYYQEWTQLAEAAFALSTGDPARAGALCAPLSEDRLFRDVAIQASSCAGEALRLLGRRDEAARCFERALTVHEAAAGAELGQRLPLGPGQRADDYYRAASLALERNRPAEAWQLLDRLDRLEARQEEERCRALQSDPDRAESWQEADRARAELQAELARVERRAVGTAEVALAPRREELRRRLQELDRRLPWCAGAGPARPAAADLRAFALPDEIVLLARPRAGGAAFVRRTPLPRTELKTLLAALRTALDGRRLEDGAWQRLTAPLAAALAPPGEGPLPAITSYALYGPLQEVPLIALPEGRPEGPERWLFERTLPVLVSTGAASSAPPRGGAEGAGLVFAVDPERNLPSGRALAETYRELFPAARILAGRAATRGALAASLAGARWLHIDAHGHYDPAYSELSSVALADGPLLLSDLGRLPVPVELVNLSGCKTARAPTSADSGRYGIAGLFARRGTAWVVASRSDLEDRVALRFNRAFYGALAGGEAVPEAFRAGLIASAESAPAAAWGGLLLLRGGGNPPPP